MYNGDGFLHLTHCTFSSNVAVTKGGALCTKVTTVCVIDSSTFVNNTASVGGAVSSKDGYLRFYNCTFKRNVAPVTAGALFFNRTSVIISHSQMVENSSPIAGTILFGGPNSAMLLTKSKILKTNHDTEPGKYQPAVSISAEKLVVSYVLFHDNKLGALSLDETRAEIHNCSFGKNTGSGAITSVGSKVLIITNTSFIENGNSLTAALNLATTNVIVQNCIFVFSALHCPSAIDIGPISPTHSTDLRSKSNVFHLVQAQSPRTLDQAIYLLSMTHSISYANLFFWDTWYQVNSSKMYAVDMDFVKNISTSDGETGSHIKVRAEFSQFASGEFQFKITLK